MKNILVAFLISTTMAQIVFAESTGATAVEAAMSLKLAMKTMSTKLKAMIPQVSDATKNESSAILADEFVQAALDAKQFLPDTIDSLPADQQASAKLKYDQMMTTVVDVGHQLATAFRNNDNAAAAAILDKLTQSKKDGHTEFKN